MFISKFKRMILSLPTEDDGHEAYMRYISDTENVTKPAAEFFTRITNYALEKTQAPVPVTRPNPRVLVAAFAIKQFPVEMLTCPEKPLQFTLLNSANNLLETIERILNAQPPFSTKTALGKFNTLSVLTPKINKIIVSDMP